VRLGELVEWMGERSATDAHEMARTVACDPAQSTVAADTHGRLAEVAAALEVEARRLPPGGEAEQKAEFVRHLGSASVAAIGNGANAVSMLREAGLGVAVLGTLRR
jgi:soluble P-type ATPase